MTLRYAKYTKDGNFCGVTTSKTPLSDNDRFTFVETGFSDQALLDTSLVEGELVFNKKVAQEEKLSQEVLELLVRQTRESLLSSCDWTQVPDAPVDKAAWATYRQALRDITSQDGFPEDVVWPTPPQ